MSRKDPIAIGLVAGLIALLACSATARSLPPSEYSAPDGRPGTTPTRNGAPHVLQRVGAWPFGQALAVASDEERQLLEAFRDERAPDNPREHLGVT